MTDPFDQTLPLSVIAANIEAEARAEDERWREAERDRFSPNGRDDETPATGAEDAAGPGHGRGPSQATRLVTLARQGDSDLFHDPAGNTYIAFMNGGHRETWPLTSRAVREWLSRRFFDADATVPGGQAVQDALATLAGFARFDGSCHEVFVRLAAADGAVYLDLANDDWEVVRIAADGWRVIAGNDAPVRFRRPRAMLPLPTPVPSSSLAPLRKLLNVNDDAFTLIVGWLLGALNPHGSYPILVLHGEQGSAKTTAGRIVRTLIDPNLAPLRTQPRDEGDLLIAASGGLLVAYDNVSNLPDWLSDGLCRLTSGGGLSKRQLYTDSDEIVLDARRPALLTGIVSTLSRADALDRALLVELDEISAWTRRTEDAVWADFASMQPGILGALLTAASVALRTLPTLSLGDLPRLADFTLWVEAGSSAFGWERRRFLTAYARNRASADELALDASPIGPTLLGFMADRTDWEGTASELLAALIACAGDAAKEKGSGWPRQPHTLSGHLKRVAPNLRRLGIDVVVGARETTGTRRRLIRIEKGSANERSKRSERSDPQNDADIRTGPSGTEAVPSGTEAVPAQNENLRNDADFLAETDAGTGWTAWTAVLPLLSDDDPLGVVPTCQRCGAVVDGGVYCDECDPYTN